MQFFEDIPAARSLIEDFIEKFGYAAEHNVDWYQAYPEAGWRNIFVQGEHGGLFTAYNDHKQEYSVVFDPLALPEHRTPLLVEYIRWIFSKTEAKKIWFQLEVPTHRELTIALSEAYRLNKTYYTLTWPIVELEKFNPEFPGGHYKTIRKELHKFYREHKVSIEAAKSWGDSDSLHQIVEAWQAKREDGDDAHAAAYHRVIDDGFRWMKEARVFVVGGKAVGMNAGWLVPNSDRFYGAIGIHDYSIDGLGTALYAEDLIYLKKQGYKEVDMGGGEKALNAFKSKFFSGPSYKTYTFSVVKK